MADCAGRAGRGQWRPSLSPPAPPTRGPPGPAVNFSFCLVSSEMLPLGDSRVGVGGVTVISGGNLVVDEGMTNFGMLGSRRDLARPGSALLRGPSGGGALPPPGALELATAGRTQKAEQGPQPPRPACPLQASSPCSPLAVLDRRVLAPRPLPVSLPPRLPEGLALAGRSGDGVGVGVGGSGAVCPLGAPGSPEPPRPRQLSRPRARPGPRPHPCAPRSRRLAGVHARPPPCGFKRSGSGPAVPRGV